MHIFDYVMVLLAAILLSNVINHFLPSLSVPIVQIILGVLIAVIPFSASGFEFELEPELFFVLFLAPLVFQSTMTADKKTMQSMINPIIMAAFGLVVVTAVIAGYFTHLLIPAIPLAAAFALAGALGPTDIVAVEAVAHRVSLPRKLVSFLSGESLVSDATGIVCFQFAIAAAATGSFNLLQVLLRFLVLALGGLLVGVVLTALKYILIRWLRSLNMNTPSLHISLGIITPFIIFMVAEQLGTSGIIAVFGAGLLHSLYRDNFNPEVINLDRANENVWSVLSFSLDGLVFVMLGTQLPRILNEYFSWEHEISEWRILVYIVLIYLTLAVIRFVWWIATVRRKVYYDPENPVGRIKSGVIFSVAGARGAVSMATVLSIPLLLSNGNAFPERDLIILIAGGVIIVSLLVTNFILPFFGKQKTGESLSNMDETARAEILQTVVDRLKESATPENFIATQIIIRNYYSRMDHHHHSNSNNDNDNNDESDNSKGKKRRYGMRNFQQGIRIWEKEIILHMAEMGQISKTTADHYVEEINKLIKKDKSGKKMNFIRLLAWTVRHFIQSFTWRASKPKKKDISEMKKINARIMRKKLRALNISENDPMYAIIAAEHERVVLTRIGKGASDGSGNSDNPDNLGNSDDSVDNAALSEVAANGLYMERVLIQQMLDAKRLSWKAAKEMQANIIMLEAQLHIE